MRPVFPLLIQFSPVSSHIDSKPDPDSGTCAGLDVRQAAIVRAVVEMYPEGRRVPASWARVIETLRKRSKRDAYLSYRQFEHLCGIPIG
jgi:hypothetical protein